MIGIAYLRFIRYLIANYSDEEIYTNNYGIGYISLI